MRTILNKILFVAILLAGGIVTTSATDVTYTADNTTIFPNPERGYYLELDHVVTINDPWCVKNRSDLDGYVSDDKLSLILVLYYLDNFKTRETLPSEVFTGFVEDMQILRQKGLKCILRFAYTADDNNGTTAYDATLDIVKKHIGQYTPYWKANEDVIYVFQTGFVGAWGEWYYTENFDNKSDQMTDKRRAVVDTLLKAVPEDRFIQLRTPKFKSEYLYGKGKAKYTEPLTAEEAYKNTPKARLGHHNDAFLYGAENMGTYTDTAKQKPYLAKETLYVPIGGETDITKKSDAENWATREKTVAEMSRLHWTFIQGYYSQTVTDIWRKNGTFDELNRNMGYRYQLVSGTYGNEAEQGGKLAVKMMIKNVGYAPLYNERHAYIVLKDVSHQHSDVSLPLEADPRKWLPNGVVSSVEEQLSLPNNIPAGTYELYLHLPDAYESLASDARYAVRFANENIWDAASGMNKLNAQVTITQTETPPTPPDDPEDPGEAVVLPATLNKSNVSAYSEDMTWYNGDYFDFGPIDAENLERWAEWKVELKYPGEYTVTIKGYYPNGHQWQLSLLNTDAVYTDTGDDILWPTGELTYTGHDYLNLKNIPAGTYTFLLKNIMAWSQSKIQSIALQYNGDIPTGKEAVGQQNADGQPQKVVEEGVVYIVSKNGSKTNLLGQ